MARKKDRDVKSALLSVKTEGKYVFARDGIFKTVGKESGMTVLREATILEYLMWAGIMLWRSIVARARVVIARLKAA